MLFNPEIHHRRSIRLKEYDYAQPGAYFVTICTNNHSCIFGDVVKEKVELSLFGLIVKDEWLRTPTIRPEVKLDEYVIMPNHFHSIIFITNHNRGAKLCAPTKLRRKPQSLSSLVAGLKSSVTKRINQFKKTPGIPVWQRNYYEHIIRNEKELYETRKYINENPLKWDLDKYNPKNA